MTYSEGNRTSYFDANYLAVLEEALVGNSIHSVDLATGKIVLSNGTLVRFDKENSVCCSYLEMVAMNATSNIITAVKVGDNETNTADEDYSAWLTVLTEAGEEINLVEADGNVGTGYYLYGFALDVTITPADFHLKK